MRAQLEKAVALGTDLRLVHDGLISETLLAYVYLNEGRLEESLRRFNSIQARAATDYTLPFLWATTAIADVTLRQGRINDAIDAAQDALEIADKANSLDQNSRFQAHGILASAWLRTEGVQRARRHLDLAIAAADKGGRMSYTAQFGFAGVAEILLALSASGKPESHEAARHLRHWLRQWRFIALMRPIFRPWYLLLRARWHAQAGRRRLAARRLRRAAWQADRMQLPYESAVTRAELARLMNLGNPARETLVDEASLIFSTIGAEAARKETQALK